MDCMNCGMPLPPKRSVKTEYTESGMIKLTEHELDKHNIRVFENGAVHLCDTHYADIMKAKTDNYSPRRFRKYLEHPHKLLNTE